jgi:hypothetical protein
MQALIPIAGVARRRFQFRLSDLLILFALFGLLLKLLLPARFPISASLASGMELRLDRRPEDAQSPACNFSKSDMQLILAEFGNATRCSSPRKWVSIGSVVCRLHSGRTVPIFMFYVDDKEMAIRTIEDGYFRGVDQAAVSQIIDRVAAQCAGGRTKLGLGK